jgi:tripartite-type tricarboxylate transporter receptor subunit TctC
MSTLHRRQVLHAAAAAALSATVWHNARAQGTAPVLKSLQLLVPTPPGTQPDVLARWLIEPIAQRAAVPGSVLNRPGAAGALAADAALAAAPESGTLLLGGLDHVAYSHLNSNRRALDPLTDFTPVGAVNRDSWMLVASPAQTARTLAALVDSSRAGAGLHYASLGEGTTAHLLSARLCQALGLQAQHVPYKDSFVPDLIAGRVQFALVPTPSALQQVKAGRLLALATLTDERLQILDGVPSIRELGHASQVFHGGLFVFAPAALAPLAGQLNGWLVDALRQPLLQARFREAGIEPLPLGLEQVRGVVVERMAQVDAMRLAVFGRTR